LIIASGAGSETRAVIGIVIMMGVMVATVFTVIVVPVAYTLLARRTGSPHRVAVQLEKELEEGKVDVDAV
jgi:multidrug efflux pump